MAFEPENRLNARNILDILTKESCMAFLFFFNLLFLILFILVYEGIKVKNDDYKKIHGQEELKEPKNYLEGKAIRNTEEQKKDDETMIIHFNLPQLIPDHFKFNKKELVPFPHSVSFGKRTRTNGVSIKKLSKIITSVEDNEFLVSALLPRKLSLLFRASEHNFRSLLFHQKCDDKGPTLTIIKTNQRIFGGFNADCWSEKYRNTSRMEEKAYA